MSAMVESALTAMPRAGRASRISFSVIPGLLVAIVRSVAACGSRIGRRWPPILAGAVLPVWRTRCIRLIAAAPLPPNPPAAARAELPASTACAIRSRKSCDIGAVMPGLSQRQPPTPGIRTFDSVQARTAITFLKETFGGDDGAGDGGLIQFIRQWCGYCLTGDVSEHAL